MELFLTLFRGGTSLPKHWENDRCPTAGFAVLAA